MDHQDQLESQVSKDQKVTQVSVVPEDVLELQERMVLQDQTAERDPEDHEVHQDHVSMEPSSKDPSKTLPSRHHLRLNHQTKDPQDHSDQREPQDQMDHTELSDPLVWLEK